MICLSLKLLINFGNTIKIWQNIKKNEFRFFRLQRTNLLRYQYRWFTKVEKKKAVELVGKIHREDVKYSPEIKRVADSKMKEFNEQTDEISDANTLKYSPSKFMKYMDTSMEKFFYQRDYSIKNFNFYLQVLTSQYKVDEVVEVFNKMNTLGIAPDSESYNHIITVHSKLGDIDKAEHYLREGNLMF